MERQIAWYLENGSNAFLKKLLREGSDSQFLAEKVLEEYEQAHAENEALPPAEAPSATDPDVMAELDRAWKELYKEASFLQQRLLYMQTDEARGEAALKILDSFDTIHEIWEKVDEYRQTGQLSVASTRQLPENTGELAQRYTNNLKYISKYRNRPDKAEEVKLRQAEINQIAKILNY